MTIEIIITEIDFWIMEAIREARIKAGLGQMQLAQIIGVSEGHIGNIENPKSTTKANIRIIARIAKALELKSYSTLMPDKVLLNDLVRVRLEILNTNTRKQVLDKYKKVPIRHNILSIEPLSEEEIELFKNKKLEYLTIIKA